MTDKKIANSQQIAYVRRYCFTEGKEAGLKIVEVNNGVLRFLLNESKALDILQLWHGSTNISFLSKNGFTARELLFSRRFEGGMLYTCGLDSVGGRDGYELHGTLHNTPARVTSISCDEEKIEVIAEVEDTLLFGKNLRLKRTVSTAIGSDSVTVSDTLTNIGAEAENYCLLYHVNLGYPMLTEQARIITDALSVTPRTRYAEKYISTKDIFPAPIDNEEERCYFLDMKTPSVSVTNPALGKSFTLNYSADTLPAFVQWNSPKSGDYALGLEPSTTALDDKFTYSVLAPSAAINFFLTLSIRHADN